MVGREIVRKASVPVIIVLIVRHEAPLPDKIPAFFLEGAAPEAVFAHHFEYARRNFLPVKLGSSAASKAAEPKLFPLSEAAAFRIPTPSEGPRAALPEGNRRIVINGSRILLLCLFLLKIPEALPDPGVLQELGPSFPRKRHRRIKEGFHRLAVRILIESDPEPPRPFHAKRLGKVRRRLRFQNLPTAF